MTCTYCASNVRVIDAECIECRTKIERNAGLFYKKSAPVMMVEIVRTAGILTRTASTN